MNSLDKTEKIDLYLSGQMSDEEKKEFEGLLSATLESSNSEKLQNEMNLQKEIIMAVKVRGLKDCLRAKEQQIRASNVRRARIVRISSWSISSLATAAILCVLFVLVPLARTMSTLSTGYAQSLDTSVLRGTATDSLHMQLEQIYALLAQEQWDEATSLSRDLMQQAADLQSDEEFDIIDDVYEQARWLYAVCEMHQGHVFRAKHLLKQIAAGNDEYYSVKAREMLEAM